MLRRQALPEGSWLIGSGESILGESLTMQGRFEEAEALLLDGCALMCNDPEAPDENKREGIERLIGLYEAWGKPQETAELEARLAQPLGPGCCE